MPKPAAQRASARPRARAERTRVAVLDAAEALFAERGFDATRLEDVAQRVGIRRASIVYYYREKRDLYDAVLARVLGELRERLAAELGRAGPIVARIEATVAAWVHFVGERPTLARILLREAADASSERSAALRAHTAPFQELVQRTLLERADFRTLRLGPIDPVHVASTVVGATVFLVAAMPALAPGRRIEAPTRERLAAHADEMRRVVRRLLQPRPGRPRGRS